LVTPVTATSGGVASRLSVTGWLALPPALVAEQVNVVPGVLAAIVVGSQPVLFVTADSGSVTLQLTVTSLVYQSLLPCVPATVGVMAGGVESCAS
jgi:hypothetical protein